MDKYYLVGFREDDGTITLLGSEFSEHDWCPIGIMEAKKDKKYWGKRAKIFEIKEIS